jgi:hypothetical protein
MQTKMANAMLAWWTLWAFSAFVGSAPLRAQGISSCIEDLALPGFAGSLKVPAVVNVDFTIGPNGKAADSHIATSDALMSAYLDAYFIKESRYSAACRGQKMHFVVKYVVEGKATFEPRYETHWRAPDELIVTCHPLMPKIN